jgi:hypothetical protein
MSENLVYSNLRVFDQVTLHGERGKTSRDRHSLMVRRLHGQLMRPLLLFIGVWVGFELAWAPPSLQAGDRIVFSRTTNTIQAPTGQGKEDKLTGSADSKLSQPAPSEFAAPPASVNSTSRMPSRAMQEMIDRQRNWAFMTPETAFVQQPDLTLDPEAALAANDPNPKRAVETYLDNQNQPDRQSPGSPSRRPGSSAFSSNPGELDDLRSEFSRSVSGNPPMNNPVPLGLFASPFERAMSGNVTPSALSPVIYPSTSSATSSDSGANESLTSTLKPKRLVSPLQDPINLLPDLTSESIQPVIGIRKSDAAHDSILGIDAANMASGGRGRNQDALTTRVLGPSSLAPAIAPFDPNRVISPPPVILEIPKRKF